MQSFDDSMSSFSSEKRINFILFSLENDDMESLKRCVKFLSLIFIIRCLISYTIKLLRMSTKEI